MNASIVRWTKTHTLLSVLFILGGMVCFLLWQTVLHTVAQGTPTCSPNYIMNIPGVPDGAKATGTIQIQFGAPVLASGIAATKVDIYSTTSGFLGSAVKQNTGANVSYWSLTLFTQLLPNAQHNYYANVSLSDGSSCNTDTQQHSFVSNNAPGTTLNTGANPASFAGPTNTVAYVDTDVSVNGISVLPFANINWETNIGTIQSVSGVSGRARLFTGPQITAGTVKATIKYGGKSQIVPIQITVGNAATPISTTSNLPSTAAAGDASKTALTQSLNAAQSATLSGQSVTSLYDCAVSTIGAARATAIKAGSSRPTASELAKLKSCIAQANNVVPSNYAPVAPESIKELSRSTDSAVTGLSNVKTNDNKEALKISGKSRPNSQVFVYVFSEPLVITTSTDAQGNWSYILEDPLAAGKHEVYALVSANDGQYRKTDAFGFSISKARISTENPSGLSLSLEKIAKPVSASKSLNAYLIVFGTVLFGGTLFSLWLFRRWNRHNMQSAPAMPTSATHGR